jgi:hypothetical protein
MLAERRVPSPAGRSVNTVDVVDYGELFPDEGVRGSMNFVDKETWLINLSS